MKEEIKLVEVNIRNFDDVMNFQRVHEFIEKYDTLGPGGIVGQWILKIKGRDTTPEEVVKEMLGYKGKHEIIITNNYEDALHMAKYYIAWNKLNRSDKKFITENRRRYLEGLEAKTGDEKEIQRAIEKYLKIWQDSGKILYIKNSVAARFIEQEGIYARVQSKKGSPDLFVFMKDKKKIA